MLLRMCDRCGGHAVEGRLFGFRLRLIWLLIDFWGILSMADVHKGFSENQ